MKSIAQVLDGTTIIVTGAAGFFATSVLLRLAQSDLKIKKIYALVRPKSSDPSQRLHKVLLPYLDHRVKGFTGSWQGTGLIRAISADVSIPNFALSEDDLKAIGEAQIFLNCAADTSFSRTYAEAIASNAGMALTTASYSFLAPNIKTHIHVSTVYVGVHLSAGETCYESFTLPNGGAYQYPNSYIATKAMAESVVNSFARIGSEKKYSVVRLSTVSPALRFPSMGFGTVSGGSPLAAFVGTELLPESFNTSNASLDCFPVDIAANQFLTLIASNHISEPSLLPYSGDQSIDVFHLAAGFENGMKVKFYNQPNIKPLKTFVPKSVFVKLYTFFVTKTLIISTNRTRYVLGLDTHGEFDTSALVQVNCEGFDVNFDNRYEAEGGVEVYLTRIRDLINEAAALKAKQAPKLIVARL